jgi:WD40 repeat protein
MTLGDDEVVRIWTLETYRCLQIICDSGERWGQITCVKWLSAGAGVACETLCIGTGRGLILLYRQSKNGVCIASVSPQFDDNTKSGQGNFFELSSTRAFTASDSVEALTFDPTRGRLATSSHNGHIQMFCLEKNGECLVRGTLMESLTQMKVPW